MALLPLTTRADQRLELHWRDLPLHEDFFYKYTQIYIASYIKVYWCHIVHIYIKEYINIKDIHMLTY